MEEQLELLKEIRTRLIEKNENGEDLFLCNIYAEIKNWQPYTNEWWGRTRSFKEEIPLFTLDNASEFNTLNYADETSRWWSYDNLVDRLAFIDWMIETIQLKEDKFILNSF